MPESRQHFPENIHHEETRRQVKKLLDARHNITLALKDCADVIESIKNARSVPCRDVIKFANNIAFSLRSPKLWTPGFPLIGAAPPAPQAEQMRAGALASYHKSSRCVQPSTDLSQQSESEVAPAEAASLCRAVVPADKAGLATAKRKAGAVEPVVASPAAAEIEVQQHKKRKLNISFGLDSDSDEDA